MYKVTITDVVCYGNGKFGHEVRTAMHRSPKETWRRIRYHQHCHYHSDSEYGGTPVLQRVQMWHNNKVIRDEWD